MKKQKCMPATLRGLFRTKTAWCKGSFEDASGAHCLLGGITYVYDLNRQWHIKQRLLESIEELFPRRRRGLTYNSVVAFNDSKSTTFADVQRVIRHAKV